MIQVRSLSTQCGQITTTDQDVASALPLVLRAAIYNSILGLGTAKSTLEINCPTGNCTFDRSNTLGFCSTCSDVTEEVTENCNLIPTTDTTSGTNCTYHLPGGVEIAARNEQIPDDYGSAEAQSPLFRKTTNMSAVALPRYQTLYGNDPNVVKSYEDPDYTTPAPAKTVFQGLTDPILGFGRIVFNESTDPMTAIGGKIMPTATECALSWCVQALDTSIQNGVLNQTVVGTWSNSSALDTSDVYLRPDFSSNVTEVGGDKGYYVSAMSNLPLVKFLQDAFNATMEGISLPGMDYTEQELFDLTIYSSDIAQALWYADDLDGLMDNLAARMTDALRNLYSDPASNATNLGKVYTTRTYVLVAWPWLILPVGLVLASCMVLFAAIISSSRHQTIVWKSSSLAPLFHGFADGEGRCRHEVYREQMEMAAEEMKVQLAEDINGDLRLVELKQLSSKASGPHSRRWMKWLGTGKQRS